MRICVLSNDNQVIGFLDNEAPSALHFYDDTLHTYLTGTAHTFEFTVPEDHKDAELMAVGNALAFYDRGKPYYLKIMTTRHTETEIMVEAWSLCLELLNETAKAYTATEPMSFAEYVKKMIYSNDILEIGVNEVSNKKITNEWTGTTDTLLKRLYSLADVFDAEIEFVPRLNSDYSLDKIVMNVYKEHSDTDQGVGERRTDTNYRYGESIDGITKTQDITNLFTCIRPTGEEELTIKNVADRTVYDDNGAVLYFHKKGSGLIYAPQAMESFPSAVGTDDKYICYNWDTDYSTEEALYGNALAKLKELCVPESTYEIEGSIDVNIGDTITVIDESFTPKLYLETRVTEQEISFTDPTKDSTTFENTKELDSKIDDELTRRVEALAKEQAATAAAATEAGTKAETASGKADMAQEAAGEAKAAAASAATAAEAANETAEAAQSTAETANTAAAEAKTTATTANATANDAKTQAAAAKAAADELETLIRETDDGVEVAKIDSDGGYVGMRTEQTADAYLIKDADGNTLASYGANKVEIGKNNNETVIDLCNGNTKIGVRKKDNKTFPALEFNDSTGNITLTNGTKAEKYESDLYLVANEEEKIASTTLTADCKFNGTSHECQMGVTSILNDDGTVESTAFIWSPYMEFYGEGGATRGLIPTSDVEKVLWEGVVKSDLSWKTLVENKTCGSANYIELPTSGWNELMVIAKYHPSAGATGAYDYAQATIPYPQFTYARDNYGTGTQVILAGGILNPTSYTTKGHMFASIRFAKVEDVWRLWVHDVENNGSNVTASAQWSAYYR